MSVLMGQARAARIMAEAFKAQAVALAHKVEDMSNPVFAGPAVTLGAMADAYGAAAREMEEEARADIERFGARA